MAALTSRTKTSGFTLIELMIVVAIVGVLAAIGTVKMANLIGKARDKVRRDAIATIRSTLEIYYNDNHHYPVVASPPHYLSSEPGDCFSYGQPSGSGDYVPGLVPNYIAALPRDPIGGYGGLPFCDGITGALCKRAYLYWSDDGTHYQVWSHCSLEADAPLQPNDFYYDPAYKTNSMVFYSGG